MVVDCAQVPFGHALPQSGRRSRLVRLSRQAYGKESGTKGRGKILMRTEWNFRLPGYYSVNQPAAI